MNLFAQTNSLNVKILRLRKLVDESDLPRKGNMMMNKRWIGAAVFVFALLLCCAQTSAQSFTLEQVMSSPFPSELVVSKRGDRLAWAFDAEGKRNIWVADGPAWAARQLTHYDADDGQELTDLV